MLKDITLGQYFPGNSILHKLDARLKILLMLAFVVLVFFAKNLLSFAYLLFLVFLMTFLSRISLKVILQGLKPIVWISVFTALINLFWTSGTDLVFEIGFIRIYSEGIWRAVYMMIRIVSLVMGTSILLTYTTSPMDLTDALESVLSPLKKLRVPVHEFAMMMSLALRFVPTLIEETEKIINAQKARGADFESGNLLSRAKALIPILIPLFISSFSRATDLAVAMECRCYVGGEGRTRLRVMRLKASDVIVLLLFLALFAGIPLMGMISLPFGGQV
ncbi:MAG: energy-coupling factor transporter transmembrane protein EcfT, partial [Clostridia bacterium]|nr:energy-coupling factor transporter transmembrane protein EcfT [Clostridia bacterium]